MKLKPENNFEGLVKIGNIGNNKDKIIEEVDKYIDENYKKSDLYVLEKKSPRRIVLNFHSNTEIANCVSRNLKLLQLDNPTFSNITVDMNVSIVNPISNKKSKDEEKKIPSQNRKRSYINKTPMRFNEKLNTVLSKSHNFSLNTFNKNNKSKNMNIFESIFLDPGPYKDKYEVIKEENRKNKALWMNKKGFDAYVGKETILKNSNFIKNYVNLEPAKEPISNIFRVDQKLKWVGKHNFYV